MSFDMLLPLSTYPDPTPGGGLRRTVALAATLGGRLTMLAQEVQIPLVGNALADALIDVSAMIADAEARSKAASASLTAAATELAGTLNLPVEARTFPCRIEVAADRVMTAARSFDVTLVAREPMNPSDFEQQVLFGSGGPVILVPAIEDGGGLDHVVIAWDNSRAAARAVRDALPILAIAGSTTILTLGDEKTVDPAGVAPLRRLLEYHGIAAMHREETSNGQPIGAALQEAALREGAGLLVMGAYGHNRLREFVLGGATRGILQDLRLPVLLSH